MFNLYSENQQLHIDINLNRKKVIPISTENTTDNSPILPEQYKQDKTNVENALNGQTKTFDYAAFKRLVLHELSYNKCFDECKCLGFTRKQIEEIAEYPECFGESILQLSNYMYLKSGYYKRLIDYFSNQAIINYTVDTQITDLKAYSQADTIKKKFISFASQVEKFNLKNEAQNIFRRLYRDDVCFAFVIETGVDVSYFYLDPMICNIEQCVSGNVFEFSIDYNKVGGKRAFNSYYYKSLPKPLQDLIDNNQFDSKGKVHIPYEMSLCLKYNNDFIFPYPPFFMMIADILLIDDYKELAKSQSINDAYKLLTMKIPTKDGQITLDGDMITTFTSMVLDTVQDNIGLITTPFDTDTKEFSSSNADDRDTVSDAISWAFKNVGVSEALMSGATNGTELKTSVTNDSGDVFRIYRQIENWVSLQMKLRGHIYNTYNFIYKILDMTIFNEKDIREKELSVAQNGIPNKMRLCASNGISPTTMFGNSMIENDIFGDVFGNWIPLKTSYTQTGDSGSAGRPEIDADELSDSGQVTRENGSNDNRSAF